MPVLIIFNATDGITATQKTFRKPETANNYVRKLRDSFKQHQGFYSTNRGERIDPEEIDYRVIDRNELYKQFV
jgi:hypothetical protein